MCSDRAMVHAVGVTAEFTYAFGWLTVLVLVVAAVVNAARHDARERAARHAAQVRAAARRDAALGMLEELADAEVREVWHVIAAVLEEGALTSGDDVRELAAALARGGGRQLAQEVAIEISDESPERVSLYHMRFGSKPADCPRDALVGALEQLARVLDELEAPAPQRG